jgi:hypothetical protein
MTPQATPSLSSELGQVTAQPHPPISVFGEQFSILVPQLRLLLLASRLQSRRPEGLL